MGLFSSMFSRKPSDGKFHNDHEYSQLRARQLKMTPLTMTQLRNFDVTDQSQLKLEYFFYTNTQEKAAALAQALAGLGYAGNFDHSASGKRQFVINGWTSKMNMDDQTVLNWTAQMCDLGQQHDCEFDGWGTNPKQA